VLASWYEREAVGRHDAIAVVDQWLFLALAFIPA
jgi:hypothetical protein